MLTNAINRKERGFEWALWLAVFGLMGIGTAFIFSATGSRELTRGAAWYDFTAVRQVAFYIVGIGLAIAFCLTDYARIARWSLLAYWFGILLLIAVPLFGVDRLGARRWIDFGLIQFQPSEFAKLSFLLALANFLARPVGELASPALFVKALSMALLPFLLILKQPDLGSALVIMPVALVMMSVAGVPQRFIWKFVGGSGLVVTLVLVDVLFAGKDWEFIKLKEYQRQRLLVYFDLDFAPKNASDSERKLARELKKTRQYNVDQALISVGSGGLTGVGWRQGKQGALEYLPRAVAHNDFIFSVLAEETGLLGSSIVLGLYGTVCLAGVRIAGLARDRLGRILASGVVALLFTHVFVNIGMNIRLMPVTGIPLPLLSAGGTSVLCSLVAIGILQNIHLYRRHY